MIKEYPPYLGLDGVLEITTLGRSTIIKMMASGKFPASQRVAGTRKVWKTQDVLDWMRERVK